MATVLPASDPVWADPDWRTKQLHSLMKAYKIDIAETSVLCNVSREMFRNWRSGRQRPIPAPNLRALMYDLQNKA